jgi:RNA polymerase sigma-70 factor (ECF subfamily)
VAGGLTDPERFRAFYAAALPRVYGYLHRRCGRDTALAEDLTQEVFLAIVGELRRGTAVADPVPWALGIARHKLLDHYRRRRRAGWVVVPWDDRDPDGAQEDALAAAALAAVDGGERALAALAAVPSPQREALVLRYLDGLPVDAVAAALGRSVGAAESLLVRGRVAFRRAYLGAHDDA